MPKPLHPFVFNSFRSAPGGAGGRRTIRRVPRWRIALFALLMIFSFPPAGADDDPLAIPPGSAPFDTRNAAEEVFGFALADSQFEQVKKWNLRSLSWWQDEAREQAAVALPLTLFQLSAGVAETDLAATLRSGPLFGIEFVADKSEEGSEESFVTFEFDARKRPDLLSYRRVAHNILGAFSSQDGEQAPHKVVGPSFLELFPVLREGWADQPDRPLTEAIFQGLVDSYFDSYRSLLEDGQTDEVVPIVSRHLQERGANFDVAEFNRLEAADLRAEQLAVSGSLDGFFDALDTYELPDGSLPSEAFLAQLIERFAFQYRLSLTTSSAAMRLQQAAAIAGAFENAVWEP